MRDLLDAARRLARKYRESVAELVAVIAEVERKRLYETAGYGSLFLYCVKDLLLPEDEAYRLIRSARVAQIKPEVLSYLADGSLSARALTILAPESRAPDFPNLLNRARTMPLREVEKIVAQRHPALPPREQTTVLALPAASSLEPPPIIYRHSFNADESLNGMIERIKGLLRHRYPEGKLEDVIRASVEHFLGDLDPLERKAAAARLGARTNPWARRVPPSVRDEVWRRDGGRCTLVGPLGRCVDTTWLELDHIVPWALGGRSDDPANLRLLCRAHNQVEARRRFGEREAF